MDTNETRALVERYYEALSKGDRSAIGDTLADDVVWEPPTGGPLEPVRRRDALLDALVGPGITELFDFSKPFALEVRSMIVEGDKAVVQQRLTATAKATGAPYDNQYCWIYTCADGRIAHMEEYANTLIAARTMAWDGITFE